MLELTPFLLRVPPDVAFTIEEVPGRSSSSLIIQHRIGSESQYQAVLKLVEQYLPKFDLYNLVSAMHKCALAARDDDMIARQVQSDPNFVKLFSVAKQKVLENLKKVEPTTLGSLLWACSRLNIFDSELTSAISADAAQRMNYYSPTAIGLLMFSLGFSGVRPRPTFIQALVTEIEGRSDFETVELTLVLYGCMRLGIRDERIMSRMSRHIIRTDLKDADPLTISQLCYAYGKLEYWDRQVMGVLSQKVVQNLKEFTPRMATMSALCFAASAQYMEDTTFSMEELLRTSEDHLKNFSHRDISTLAFAAGKFSLLQKARRMNEQDFGIGDEVQKFALPASKDVFFCKVQDEIKRRKQESFTMQELNLITYAMMRREHHDEEFLESAALLFQENAAELMSIEIVNVLYSFAKNKYLHIGMVQSMIDETKRRNLLDEMDPLQVATMAYALAFSQIRQEDLMDRIAVLVCEKVRMFEPQALSMLMWAMASLNCRNHADALVSVVSEEIARNWAKFDPTSLSIIIWACTILSGPSSAIWLLKGVFAPAFWEKNFTTLGYTMIYHMFASLRAELGMPVEDLTGHYICRRVYEESTAESYGLQHQRLSERLRMQQIPHQANAMAPKLEGFEEAGVRVDIAIPKLSLVIEVEGPQRNTIPLDKLSEKLKEERQTMVSGDPSDVLSQAKDYVECGLVGSAAFKRRLLRKCGWRVVTVSFEESEEYIADALKNMIEKDSTTGQAASSASDPMEDALSAIAPTEEDLKVVEEKLMNIPEDLKPNQAEISAFEKDLRLRHRTSMKDMLLRIAEERGDAARSAAYANHLEYRQWQVNLEKSLMTDLVSQVASAND